MGAVYFDSSALVKLVVDERGSALAAQLWNACDAALASPLAYIEVRAALGALHRNQVIDDRGLRRAERTWEECWSGVRPVALSLAVSRTAGALAVRHSLTGGDAVHLASAVAIASIDPVMAVWDVRLHAAAGALGLKVAPLDCTT